MKKLRQNKIKNDQKSSNLQRLNEKLVAEVKELRENKEVLFKLNPVLVFIFRRRDQVQVQLNQKILDLLKICYKNH